MDVGTKAGKGKFGHVGAPNYQKTSVFESCQNSGVSACRGRVGQDCRSGAGGNASLVKQVLDRQWNAGIAGQRPSFIACIVNCVSLIADTVMIDCNKGAGTFTSRIINCGKAVFGKAPRGDLTASEGTGEIIKKLGHGYDLGAD